MRYSKTLLKKLYQEMLVVRYCEESFVDPILAGDIHCPCHLYSGRKPWRSVCALL
jgi:TPP-dependent pyruvate/acetoin dehydrogenase alpha subunit